MFIVANVANICDKYKPSIFILTARLKMKLIPNKSFAPQWIGY